MHSRRLVRNQSESFAKQKRSKSFLLAGLVMVTVFSWLFVIYRVTHVAVFSITVVEVEGASQEIVGSIRAAAEDSMEGNYLFMFSRASSFLYPRGRIMASVLNSSPRIEEVSVKRNKLNSIVVSVKEKTPSAMVCVTLPDFVAGKLIFGEDDDCALADESGYIFKSAPSVSGAMYNRYYIPNLLEVASTSRTYLGMFATTTDEFVGLQEFYESLKKNGIEVQAILFKDNGEYEAYVNNPHAKGSDDTSTAVIYFNNSKTLNLELDNLVLFWAKALEESKVHKKLPEFEYVDVRYSPNVFFRDLKK